MHSYQEDTQPLEISIKNNGYVSKNSQRAVTVTGGCGMCLHSTIRNLTKKKKIVHTMEVTTQRA